MTPVKLSAVALTAPLNPAFVLLVVAAEGQPREAGDDAPGDRLTRAARIAVDFDDALVGVIAQAIGERSGKRIQQFRLHNHGRDNRRS